LRAYLFNSDFNSTIALGLLAMDKGAPPSIFVNDGSFMERFRQLQQEKDKDKDKVVQVEDSKPVKIISNPKPAANKISIGLKPNDAQKKGGKLAFSLKQKSKLLAPPVKLGTEEDEDDEDVKHEQGFGSVKRQKLEQRDTPVKSATVSDVGNACLYKYLCSLWKFLCWFYLSCFFMVPYSRMGFSVPFSKCTMRVLNNYAI